jgi:hypothetical protein
VRGLLCMHLVLLSCHASGGNLQSSSSRWSRWLLEEDAAGGRFSAITVRAKNNSSECDSSHCTLPLAREMSGSFGIGVKMTGKKPVLIEGVDQANCDFASMDAPRSLKKDSIRDDSLPKSGNMSADMDAALRKLENRRAAASLTQTPHAPANSREEARPQYVSTRCSNPLR